MAHQKILPIGAVKEKVAAEDSLMNHPAVPLMAAGGAGLLGLFAGRRIGGAIGSKRLPGLSRRLAKNKELLEDTERALRISKGEGALKALGLVGAGTAGASIAAQKYQDARARAAQRAAEKRESSSSPYKLSSVYDMERIGARARAFYKAAMQGENLSYEKVASLDADEYDRELTKAAWQVYEDMLSLKKEGQKALPYMIGGGLGAVGLSKLIEHTMKPPAAAGGAPSGGGDSGGSSQGTIGRLLAPRLSPEMQSLVLPGVEGAAGAGLGYGLYSGMKREIGDLPSQIKETGKAVDQLKARIPEAKTLRGGAKGLQTSLGKVLSRFL